MVNKIISDKTMHIKQTLIGLGVINFFILLGLLINPTWRMIIGILTFDMIAILYFSIKKKFASITINKVENVITIEHTNILGYKSFIKTETNNLEYTYKTEAISRFTTTATLRLYLKNNTVIKLNKYNGLSEYLLDNIVFALNEDGVKRKFMGYQLKDKYPV